MKIRKLPGLANFYIAASMFAKQRYCELTSFFFIIPNFPKFLPFAKILIATHLLCTQYTFISVIRRRCFQGRELVILFTCASYVLFISHQEKFINACYLCQMLNSIHTWLWTGVIVHVISACVEILTVHMHAEQPLDIHFTITSLVNRLCTCSFQQDVALKPELGRSRQNDYVD